MTPYVLYPSNALRSIVLRYECLQIEAAGPTIGKVLFLPSLVNDFIFSFYPGAPPLVTNLALQRAEVPKATLLSSLSGRTEVERIGPMQVIRVVFVPGVVSLLYKVDLDSLKNRPISLGRDIHPNLKDLYDEMSLRSNPQDRVALIEAHLLTRMRYFCAKDHLYPRLTRYLEEGNYPFKVPKLAQNCFYSDRQLNRKVKGQHGVASKEFIALYRNNALLRYLRKNPNTPLGEVGYKFGFNDQSHFVRTFKLYAGLTPSNLQRQLQASERIFPQVDDHTLGAGMYIVRSTMR